MPYKDALQRAHEVLNYVGIPAKSAIAGWRRIQPACGSVQNSRRPLCTIGVCVFLDEPTNGLDPVGRIAMLELIREVARTRRMAVLSSHLLPDVEHVCKRVALLDQRQADSRGGHCSSRSSSRGCGVFA